MNIAIDWTRCAGHGLCAELMPDRISRDRWGFPLISRSNVSAAEEREARRVIAVCPALALRLTSEEKQ